MQDSYTGDVGDYGKYGLLLALSSDDRGPIFRLGLVWYLVVPKPDGDGKDGKHTSYLCTANTARRNHYRNCNPPLYDHLHSIVCATQDRRVARIREEGIFPSDTVFCEEPLPTQERRTLWMEQTLLSTTDCDLVFLDPDNGLKLEWKGPSPKHVYFGELMNYLDRGQSIVFYHHSGRNRPVDEQINTLLLALRQKFQDRFEVFALRYRRGTSRAFIVISQVHHRNVLKGRASQFAKGAWGQSKHFEGHLYPE